MWIEAEHIWLASEEIFECWPLKHPAAEGNCLKSSVSASDCSL